MSKRSSLRLALLPAATMAVALSVTHLTGAEPGPEAARLDGFTHTDGANYCFLVCMEKFECNDHRLLENEANCSASVTFVSGTMGRKACVPPSGS